MCIIWRYGMDIKEIMKSYKDYVIKFRREFYENFEKSMEEVRILKRVKEEFDKIGILYVLVGGIGVIVIIKGVNLGKIVVFRGDMDVL